MLAAAEAPASPLPTTITVNFRLLAGFTSLRSNWWRLPLLGERTGGTFAFSSMTLARELRDCATPVPCSRPVYVFITNPSRTASGTTAKPTAMMIAITTAALRLSGDADGLRHAQRPQAAPGAVIQVQRQRCHRHDVEHGDQRALQRAQQVGVDVALLERRVHRADRQVEQVIDDEDQQQHPAPAQRARRQRRHLGRADRVLDRPRRAVPHA